MKKKMTRNPLEEGTEIGLVQKRCRAVNQGGGMLED